MHMFSSNPSYWLALSLSGTAAASHRHTFFSLPLPLVLLRYDQAVFLGDFCERVGLTTVRYMHTLESTMLHLLNFETAVSRALYLRYCFALQDVMPSTLHLGMTLALQDGTSGLANAVRGHHRRARSDGDSMVKLV